MRNRLLSSVLLACVVVCFSAPAIGQEVDYTEEPFRKPVARYSREDHLRTEYATLRYLANYVIESPQKTEIDRLMHESETAYRAGNLDVVAEVFDRIREAMKNAPMKGGIPSPRGELSRAIDTYDTGAEKDYPKADEIVDRIISNQHLTEGSAFYGGYYYPEYVDYPPAYDMFLLSRVAYLAKHCGDKMAPTLRKKLLDSFDHVLKGLIDNWHEDKEELRFIGHTNYYLMYLEGLMILGEIKGHAEAMAKAYKAFDVWTDYVARYGITEFNAPTYYGVNFESLSRIYRDTVNDRARGQAKACLDFIMLDMATHYWPERRWLTGANGRSYATLGGVGGNTRLFERYWEGPEPYRAPDSSVPMTGGTILYELPDYIRKLAVNKPGVIEFEGKWGPQYGQDRTTYITGNFALGTSGMEYGSQDRPLVIDLHSEKLMPQIVFVLDTTGDPYRLPERGGWSGTNHDPVGISSVQHKRLALVLGDLDFKSAKLQREYVAPTLTIPANVDRLAINEGEITNRSAGTKIPMTPDDVLFVGEGRTTVAVRIVPASPLADRAPTYRLQFDGNVMVREFEPEKGGRGGKEVPMARLVVSLYEGEDREFDRDNVLVGFVVALHEGDPASTRQFMENARKSRVTLKPYGERVAAVFRMDDDRLGIERDMSNNLTLNRWVNNRHVAPRAFHSNIFDLAEDSTVTVRLGDTTHQFRLIP